MGGSYLNLEESFGLGDPLSSGFSADSELLRDRRRADPGTKGTSVHMQAERLALSRIRNSVQQLLDLGRLFAAFFGRLDGFDDGLAVIGDAGLRLEGLVAVGVFALRADRVGNAEFDAGLEGLAECLSVLRVRLEHRHDQLVVRAPDNVLAFIAVVLAHQPLDAAQQLVRDMGDQGGKEPLIAIRADVLYRGHDVSRPQAAKAVAGGDAPPTFQVGWRGRFLGRLGTCLHVFNLAIRKGRPYLGSDDTSKIREAGVRIFLQMWICGPISR